MTELHDLDDQRSYIRKCDNCYMFAIHHHHDSYLCWKCYGKVTEKPLKKPTGHRLLALDEEIRWGL